MSVAGILSSAAFSLGAQIFQSGMHKTKNEFQQLGQHLQSGNLSAAQADFATLQKMQPQPPASSSTPSSNPIAQDFTQLATDLKAGNTTAAQQDFTKLQQDFQSQATQAHHHRHHSGGDGSSDVGQLFAQVGSALQSGDLSAAQKAYAAMLQDVQQYAQTNALPGQSGSTGVSLTA